MAIDAFKGRYSFLSNFHPVLIKYDGVWYKSVEAAYQAAKTLDPEERKKFADMSASEAKKAGRRVKLRPDWERVKLTIMHQLLIQKFTHPNLKQELLATGDEKLIEGNWWGDTFWGVCKGVGRNHLGRLLMSIREELRKIPTSDTREEFPRDPSPGRDVDLE